MEDQFSVDMALADLRSRFSQVPQVGIVLGSGLSAIGDRFPGTDVSYTDIPGMPRSTVAGHRGSLKVSSKSAVFLGRFHHYEGYSFRTVAFNIFLMKKWGVKTVILTNAAGGLKETYTPGQLVLIGDHVNLMGGNPFLGPHEPIYGPRFFDMTDTYTAKLRERTQKLQKKLTGQFLDEGVYAGLTGPCYETPAEIRYLKTIGADLVGMSTVPEAIAARSCGLDLLGISCVTNLAAGIAPGELSHSEVMENGKKAEKALGDLLLALTDDLTS